MTCPVMILEGHDDWCFSAEFISHNHLVSGGRDGNVKVWNVMPDSDPILRQPLLTRKEHERKVRDLKYNPNIQVANCTIISHQKRALLLYLQTIT
jgi:WD40 repeat protein